MLGKKPGTEYAIRVVIVILTAGEKICLQKDVNLPWFIICLLVFLLSSQIRIVFLKERLFIVSVFVELAIVYYINSHFGGISCLLVLIPMSDSLLLLDIERWFISAASAGVLTLSIWRQNTETIALVFALFALLFFLSIQIRKLRDEVEGMETLYDENRKYGYQLESAKARLEEYSRKVEQMSQMDERSRISGELHDTVGHKLTGVLMQLEAAIRINSADTLKGRDMLGSVRDNLSGCIDLLRQTVRNMKPAGNSGRALSIRQMAADFARNAGINVDFKISGNPFKLYPSAEITLLKNAQEALTNAVRHGRAANIRIELEYYAHEVVLTVADDGAGCRDMVKGMGISGMEERAALLGGKLEISSGGGFEIKTVIPVVTGERCQNAN